MQFEGVAWLACMILLWILRPLMLLFLPLHFRGAPQPPPLSNPGQGGRATQPWTPHINKAPERVDCFMADEAREEYWGTQGGRGRAEAGSEEGRRGDAGFRGARVLSPPPSSAARGEGVKRRLSEKRQLELGYRGPMRVTEDNNPFHTRGASEYISARQYEAQCNAATRQALEELNQYVTSTDYLQHNADRLSAQARRGLARQIAFDEDFSMPEGYYDD